MQNESGILDWEMEMFASVNSLTSVFHAAITYTCFLSKLQHQNILHHINTMSKLYFILHNFNTFNTCADLVFYFSVEELH